MILAPAVGDGPKVRLPPKLRYSTVIETIITFVNVTMYDILSGITNMLGRVLQAEIDNLLEKL